MISQYSTVLKQWAKENFMFTYNILKKKKKQNKHFKLTLLFTIWRL